MDTNVLLRLKAMKDGNQICTLTKTMAMPSPPAVGLCLEFEASYPFKNTFFFHITSPVHYIEKDCLYVAHSLIDVSQESIERQEHLNDDFFILKALSSGFTLETLNEDFSDLVKKAQEKVQR